MKLTYRITPDHLFRSIPGTALTIHAKGISPAAAKASDLAKAIPLKEFPELKLEVRQENETEHLYIKGPPEYRPQESVIIGQLFDAIT